MKIERFEDILAWQKVLEMTKEIYLQFRSVNDYGFRDQIQRTAVSVMNIIAEGFERRSDAEFRHFYLLQKAPGEKSVLYCF